MANPVRNFWIKLEKKTTKTVKKEGTDLANGIPDELPSEEINNTIDNNNNSNIKPRGGLVRSSSQVHLQTKSGPSLDQKKGVTSVIRY